MGWQGWVPHDGIRAHIGRDTREACRSAHSLCRLARRGHVNTEMAATHEPRQEATEWNLPCWHLNLQILKNKFL